MRSQWIALVVASIGAGACLGGDEAPVNRIESVEDDGFGMSYLRNNEFWADGVSFQQLVADVYGVDTDGGILTVAPDFEAPDGVFSVLVSVPGGDRNAVRSALRELVESHFGCKIDATTAKATEGKLVVIDSTKLVPSAREAASVTTAPHTTADEKGNVDTRWDYSCEGCTLRQLAIQFGWMDLGMPVYGLDGDGSMYDFRFDGVTEKQLIEQLRDVYGIEIQPEEYTTATKIVVNKADPAKPGAE